MRWRALFAALTAAVSIDYLADLVVYRFALVGAPVRDRDIAMGCINVVGLGLIIPLIRGRNWARVALIVAVIGFALTLSMSVLIVAWQTQWGYSHVSLIVSAALDLFIAALVVLALMHPEVRRDFEHS